ncbi:MAG: YibE/F family protein [Microbacteriaceae bacterium]
MWPQGELSIFGQEQAMEADDVVVARVVSIAEHACAGTGGISSDSYQSNRYQCFGVTALLPDGTTVNVELNGINEMAQDRTPLKQGDTVKIIRYQQMNQQGQYVTEYGFYDHDRGVPLLIIVLVFIVIVVGIGRWKGLLALFGVIFSVFIFSIFILPAILAGEHAVTVASVGSAIIMLVVLFLAHGISLRTTAALFGSFFGIAFTAIFGVLTTQWAHITGMGSMGDGSTQLAMAGLNVSDIFTATIIIAGLGVLNDITVSQASAVLEMRELNPNIESRRIFASAMRIGRDHIASSIYTLVFAYAGATLLVLLMLYIYPTNIVDLITSERIAQEIVRTLVGVSGLILAMPVTTFFAVYFTKGSYDPRVLSS